MSRNKTEGMYVGCAQGKHYRHLNNGSHLDYSEDIGIPHCVEAYYVANFKDASFVFKERYVSKYERYIMDEDGQDGKVIRY